MIALLLLGCQPEALPPAAPPDFFADAGPDVEVQVGAEVTLDGSGSEATGGARWDVGDGTVVDGVVVRHTYDTPGNYVAVLSVTGDGGVRRSDTARITVYAPAADPAPAASSAIAFDPTRREAWVAVPEAGHVVIVNVDTAESSLLPVCAGPRSVAWADGVIGVACEDDDELVLLDAASRSVNRVWPLGAGVRPFGVVGRGGTWWVTGQGRGEIITVTGGLLDRAFPGPDPRAVGLTSTGEWLATRWRSSAGGGQVYSAGVSYPIANDPGPDSDTQNRGVPTVLGALALSPDGARAWVGGHVANTERGLFVDGDPLDPGLTVRATVRVLDLGAGERLSERKVFDNQGEVAALAVSPRGTWLWVAHRGTHTIHLLDAFTLQTAGSILNAGAGIDALSITPDGGTLLVHAWLDRELHAWDITDPSDPKLRWSVPTVSVEPLTPEVLLGKRLFYDSRDERLARAGYLSCGVCHPDGRDDGMTWDFTQRGEGLRNTITLEGRGGLNMGRLHWTGNFDEVQDFEGDIRLHQGGAGLLAEADWSATADPLGPAKAGRSADLDALAAYVASLDRLPVSPWPASAGGEDLFYDFGCDTCHLPALDYTDSSLADPVRHDVGSARDGSGQRLGAELDGFDTPTLRGVFSTGPWLHDGRAATLEAAITGHGALLPAPDQTQRVTLATWLRSL